MVACIPLGELCAFTNVNVRSRMRNTVITLVAVVVNYIVSALVGAMLIE